MRNLVRLAIADDDEQQASALCALVERLRPTWKVLPPAGNAEQLRATLNELVPDILLLDLHMPGFDGYSNSLEGIQSVVSNLVTILITGDPTFALEAYERAASDYLVKPVRPSRLDQALRRAETMLFARNWASSSVQTKYEKVAWIPGSRGRDVVLINPDDIVYLQAERKYTTAILEGTQVLLRKGIADVEALLDKSKFLRIHRSTIVNVSYVEFLRRDEMGRLRTHLRNRPENLIVSRSFEQIFKDVSI